MVINLVSMKRLSISVVLAIIISITFVAPAFARDGSKVQFGKDIQVPVDQVADGDVVTFGGNITVDGRVFGDAVAFGGNVDVSGEVIGQVVSFGGTVHLAPTAKVQRGVVTVGGVLLSEPGAEVHGDIVETGPGLTIPRIGQWSFGSREVPPQPNTAVSLIVRMIVSLMLAVALVAIAALTAVVFPSQLGVVRTTMEAVPIQTFGIGVLSVVVAIALSPILFFTCIGLPIFWLAVGIATIFGSFALSILAGERLLNAVNRRDVTPVLAVVVGVLAIWLASHVPILGGILMFVVFSIGLGAVVLSRFGTIAPPFSWQTKSPPRAD